jgi:hypothetical protein
VRPYTHTDHYWQVYFDTNEAIVRTCKEAGWPAPTPAQITPREDLKPKGPAHEHAVAKVLLVTGGSRGIGAACCRQAAAPAGTWP